MRKFIFCAVLSTFFAVVPAYAACTACSNYPPMVEPPVVYTPPPAPLAYTAPIVPPTPVMSMPVMATAYAAPVPAPAAACYPAVCPVPAPLVACDICPVASAPTSLPGFYDYSGAGLSQPGLSYLVPSVGGMVETTNPQQTMQQNEIRLRSQG